ncbi:MAG: hypothetical protein KatS3mg126_1458 [Lysobacteraceae bacterium]|nr:MAG: hypothetical protein KatS3mg126_1458 [Xanthomonadaceae bacterium]
MAVERVTRTGWLARVRGAFVGVLVGLLLVAGAGVLQFWNEGRTVRQRILLETGQREVVSIDAAEAARHEGRLVHLSDRVHASGKVEDPEFNQIAEGLGLRRRVEMYQWRERKETREETSVGGSKTRRTTYHYEQVWDDDLIDSGRFAEPEGHRNPERMPFSSRRWLAREVWLGTVRLDPQVMDEIDGWKPMAVQAERLPPNLAATFGIEDGVLTTVSGEPRIGDLRIRYERLPEGPLSVVGRLADGVLGPDPREQGTLLLVERGAHDAASMFAAAHRRNAGIGWALRGAGFVAMWIGFAMVLAPLAVLADVVPIFGRMTRWVSALIGGVLAAVVSLVAIGSGWLYHRPWMLGVLLLALAAGLFWALVLRPRSRAAGRSAGPPPPPPPSPGAPR